DDAALEEQPLEYLRDIELVVARVADAERDVLEIAEKRHAGHVGRCGHASSVGRKAIAYRRTKRNARRAGGTTFTPRRAPECDDDPRRGHSARSDPEARH